MWSLHTIQDNQRCREVVLAPEPAALLNFTVLKFPYCFIPDSMHAMLDNKLIQMFSRSEITVQFCDSKKGNNSAKVTTFLVNDPEVTEAI